SIALLLLLPFLLFQFHHQVHPLVGQFPKTFVISDFLPHFGQALRAHEASAALAPPGETKVVIRTVLLGILGSLQRQSGLPQTLYCSLKLPGWMGPSLASCCFRCSILRAIGVFFISDIITVISDIVKHF